MRESRRANSGSNWSAYDIQRLLWEFYSRRLSWLGSGISAFPSLHMAMVTLWTIVGFQANRILGFVGIAFLGLFHIASVALGWHYVIDGVASIMAVLLIWTVVGLMLGHFADATQRAGVAVSGPDRTQNEPCR